MDFNYFLGLCGRSLFAEEYRGDLDAAEDYLRQTRPDASSPTDLETYAEYLRCSMVFESLRGRPADAYESLAKLEALLGQLPKEWGLRYANYKALNDYTRRFPPLLRFYHENGKPVDVSMLGNVVTPAQITSSFLESSTRFAPCSLPQDQSFSLMLSAVMGVPFLIRNLAYTYHPLSPKGPTEASRENLLAEVTQHCQYLGNFREVADSQGLTGIGTYLFRLIVEIHLACQSPAAESLLQELYRRCELFEDFVGMANAKIMEADSRLSPPFASPLTLNMIITDPTTATMSDVLWGPVESCLSHTYDSVVHSLYESAQRLFQRSGCRRGQAAVLLRQGCLLHDQARHERLQDGKRSAVLTEAELKLQEALALFGKDEANVALARTHLVLLGITKGSADRAKVMSLSIADWSVKAQNEVMAHCLGMIISRFAYQEWYKFSNLDNAILAWECANTIFEAHGDMVPLLQSLVCRAHAQHGMFNANASRILIEEALSKVDGVVEWVNRLLESIPDTPVGNIDRTVLSTGKFQILNTLDSEVVDIFRYSEDLERFDEWCAKYSHWLEHDESFIAFRKQLETGDIIQITHDMLPLSEALIKGMWQKHLTQTAATVRYSSAEVTFRRLLEEGDVIEAEKSFRRFIDDTTTLEQSYSRDLYRILACQIIGDASKAREIFDSISDEEVFGGQLGALRKGVGVKEFFASLAQNAITFAVFAGDRERSRRFIDIIIEIQPGFFDDMDDDAMSHAHRLSSFGQIMRNEQPEISFAKLLEARRILETRRMQTYDLDARIGSSNRGWVPDVYVNLARLCLRWQQNEAPLGILLGFDHGHFDNISWAEHALLFIEMSRARSLLDSLQTQARFGFKSDGHGNIALLSEAIYKRRLLRSLLAESRLSSEQHAEVTQLRKDLEDLEQGGKLTHTTAFFEKADSLTEPKFLFQSIGLTELVIETTFTPRGCVSFAITSDGIQRTHQGTTNSAAMRRLAMQVMQILQVLTGYAGPEEESRKERLSELTRQISAILLEPFEDILRARKHVIFSVSDPLTAFPFACLPFDEQPLILHAGVSQIPSLTVLHHLAQRKSVSQTPTISVIAKSPVEDMNSNQNHESKEDSLYMAGIEAVKIARIFGTTPIEASHMTRDEFRKHLQGSSLILHVGTHGNLNHRQPLLSSISIGEADQFRVIDMSAIHSNVHLLVFAACLSGLGKATFTSEVLGFSHVVLSTGCQAYIGSLWKVSDFGSMLIMTLFYRHLKASPHMPIAELLQMAQIEVFKLNERSAGELLDEIMENWSQREQNGFSAADFVPEAEYLILTLRMVLDQLDWTSPFFWAPFTLMGYGGFCFVHEDRGSSQPDSF